MRAINLFLCLLLFIFSVPGNAQDIAPYTSLVYPGTDGKLIYIADSLGNKIPDFSNAGYKGGGVSIPYVPAKAIVWPLRGDNSDHIQKIIDSVSNLPSFPVSLCFGDNDMKTLYIVSYTKVYKIRTNAEGYVNYF